jgi:enolase-phosphatase E1
MALAAAAGLPAAASIRGRQEETAVNTLRFESISHVLLDIEGTTCPVSFVKDTLFPYAARQLEEYLNAHAAEHAIQQVLAELQHLWRGDPDPQAQSLRCAAERMPPAGTKTHAIEPKTVLPYLQWLITADRKLTPLKDLQGRIWREGYDRGELQGPLFADVSPALHAWAARGLVLAVYSSGSVQAQKLLYGHSSSGDLRSLFSHWFDTKTGSKQDASSYTRISDVMGTAAEHVLFISDAIAELHAASAAGMSVIFSKRDGNPEQDGCSYPCTSSLATIQFNDQISIA